MEWILTIISLVGNYLNCKKMVVCFYIWIGCNIGWTIIDIVNGVYSRAILDIVQIGFSVYGIVNWRKDNAKQGKS